MPTEILWCYIVVVAYLLAWVTNTCFYLGARWAWMARLYWLTDLLIGFIIFVPLFAISIFRVCCLPMSSRLIGYALNNVHVRPMYRFAILSICGFYTTPLYCKCWSGTKCSRMKTTMPCIGAASARAALTDPKAMPVLQLVHCLRRLCRPANHPTLLEGWAASRDAQLDYSSRRWTCPKRIEHVSGVVLMHEK